MCSISGNIQAVSNVHDKICFISGYIQGVSKLHDIPVFVPGYIQGLPNVKQFVQAGYASRTVSQVSRETRLRN